MKIDNHMTKLEPSDDLEDCYDNNVNHYKMNKMTGDYLIDMIWITESRDRLPVGKMSRPHVQNSLQWCMRRNSSAARDIYKDGYSYQEWITAFTVRLLDPALK